MSLNASDSVTQFEQSDNNGFSEKIFQANTETLQRYTELMGMFYIENTRWLQNIYDSCYQRGLSRSNYLLEVYRLIGMKFVSQIDSDVSLLQTSEERLTTMVVILISILTSNPNISKEDCMKLCEEKLKNNNDTPHGIELCREIISTVFDRFPIASS